MCQLVQPVSRFTVDRASAGLRLDAFLKRQGAAESAAGARRLVAAGLVRVDGWRARKGVKLRAQQTVEVRSLPSVLLVPEREVPLVLLHQDEDIVAVLKPAGAPSHPLRPGEGPSVAAALVARFPECAHASPDMREGGLAHRLDRGTSGVLFAARRPDAWRGLRAALGAPDCEKVYLAEVVGDFPSRPPPGARLASAGPRPGSLLLTAPVGRIGRRGSRVKLAGGRKPLPARTEIAALERRGATTLVEARLVRGRAHQVRAHLAYLGCPVVGDHAYGAPALRDPGELHLHAHAVELRHPQSGRRLRITAPPPPWAQAIRAQPAKS